MAKGVHSKRRKRNQSIKRKILEQSLWGPSLEETSKRLFKRTFGTGDDSIMKLKKNAFRYPNDPEAVIPQAITPKFIDKRTSAAPTEFLIKENEGMKKKNLIKKENKKNLDKLLREAQMRAEGKEREDDIIELEMLQEDEVDTMNFDKANISEKKKKFKESGMEIDVVDNSRNRNLKRKRNSHKKKSKSHYIVNY